MKKISVCTVCMNRLSYLIQTLPVNIAENSDYPHLEFVVLNYNSRDGMDDWIRTNLSEHIESGLLKHYKTTEPQYFNLAHSKNLVTKLATGDIVCNIDADNFAGPGYLKWVGECFSRGGPDTLITTIRKDAIPYRDQGGKICFTKANFNAVNGYDESLIGYGMDDVDLTNRLENAGARRVFIDDEKFLRFIGHSDLERIVHYKYPGNLKTIYVCVTESAGARQRVLYLFTDDTAAELYYSFNEDKKGNLVTTFAGWTVDQQGHQQGSFRETTNLLELSFPHRATISYWKESGFLTPMAAGDGLIWKEITSQDGIYFRLLMGYNECLNRLTLVENERNQSTVNGQGWGRGTVYLNFDSQDALAVV